MDKLSESQRASIAKMSDERLQSKLSKAGYAPEILTQFTRSDLMKAVAEVMIAEDEQQAAAAAQFGVEVGVEDRPREMKSMAEVTDGMKERRILLEERRMELEERKWRAEMELREREVEREREFIFHIAKTLNKYTTEMQNYEGCQKGKVSQSLFTKLSMVLLMEFCGRSSHIVCKTLQLVDGIWLGLKCLVAFKHSSPDIRHNYSGVTKKSPVKNCNFHSNCFAW